MCGGFTCSKNALTALNILYILVAFILIGVATYGKAASLVSSLPIIGGIIACGVFLLMISIVGLIGAVRHHQVLLFFYMVILFLLFVIQFGVACACLGVNEAQQHDIAKQGWLHVSNETRQETQTVFKCCGFENQSLPASDRLGHPSCAKITECCAPNTGKNCCAGSPSNSSYVCNCPPCFFHMRDTIRYAFRVSGGIGLFFSFTEIAGWIIAYRYRNMMDPQAAPAAASLTQTKGMMYNDIYK